MNDSEFQSFLGEFLEHFAKEFKDCPKAQQFNQQFKTLKQAIHQAAQEQKNNSKETKWSNSV